MKCIKIRSKLKRFVMQAKIAKFEGAGEVLPGFEMVEKSAKLRARHVVQFRPPEPVPDAIIPPKPQQTVIVPPPVVRANIVPYELA